MPRFLLTYISLFLFLSTMVLVDYGEVSAVSQGTLALPYREIFLIKAGMSLDGQLQIEQVPDAPSVSAHALVANHVRNLRVFVAPDYAGAPTLYLEQVKPHNFFIIRGPFAVSPVTEFMWVAPTSFLFYATSTSGIMMSHSVNVHTLLYHTESVGEGASSLAPQVVVD